MLAMRSPRDLQSQSCFLTKLNEDWLKIILIPGVEYFVQLELKVYVHDKTCVQNAPSPNIRYLLKINLTTTV